MRVRELLVVLSVLHSGVNFCAQQQENTAQETVNIPLAHAVEQTPAVVHNELSDDPDTASMQRIITTFARIAHSFFTIAASKNPKDPILLGQNLTNMAAGVINIAMEMFRGRALIDDEQDILYTYTLTDEDVMLLNDVVASFKKQLIDLDKDATHA